MDKPWKRFERKVAAICGGERIPVSDRRTPLDVKHDLLGIECKFRTKLPKWLFNDAWNQAVAGCKGTDLIPTVVAGEKGNSNAFAIITLEDLMKILDGRTK